MSLAELSWESEGIVITQCAQFLEHCQVAAACSAVLKAKLSFMFLWLRIKTQNTVVI